MAGAILDDLVDREVPQPGPLRQELAVGCLAHAGGACYDDVWRRPHDEFGFRLGRVEGPRAY